MLGKIGMSFNTLLRFFFAVGLFGADVAAAGRSGVDCVPANGGGSCLSLPLLVVSRLPCDRGRPEGSLKAGPFGAVVGVVFSLLGLLLCLSPFPEPHRDLMPGNS